MSLVKKEESPLEQPNDLEGAIALTVTFFSKVRGSSMTVPLTWGALSGKPTPELVLERLQSREYAGFLPEAPVEFKVDTAFVKSNSKSLEYMEAARAVK